MLILPFQTKQKIEMWFTLLVLLLIVLLVLSFLFVLPILKVRNDRPMKIYQTIKQLPLIGGNVVGDWYLTRIIGLSAPYTSSISPRVELMSEEKTLISIQERYGMKNPFNSIHAAALVNLGDLVCGIQVTNQIVPRKLRAIPVEIKAEYPKKSRGKIIASCDTKVPELDQMQLINGKPGFTAIAELRDESGDLTAKITMIWSCAAEPSKKRD